MKIIAKTVKGKEFLYNVHSVHKVSEKSAGKILELLNSFGWKCKPGEIWHIYEIDNYSAAFDVAQFQYFKLRKGNLYANTAYKI